MYRWEFERGEEAIEVVAPGPVSVDASAATLTCGLGGVGVIYGAEPVLRPHIDAGALTQVCAQWSSMGSGFHAYFSGRRQVPTALRLLIDLICEARPMGTD